MSSIRHRLGEIRTRMVAACERVGRAPESVLLIAVSKTRTETEIAEAVECGQLVFGENRVQEAFAKGASWDKQGLVLHLIGHLQKNKAKQASQLFDVIHSVDSVELLTRLDRVSERALQVLIQVKLVAEEAKSGVSPEGLGMLLEVASGLERVRVVGLMVIPPPSQDPEATRAHFRALVKLRDDHGGVERLPHLSMGMSHDFEVAIEEGATMVRVGQAIFGPRGAAA